MKYEFGDSVQLTASLRPCEVVAITPVESPQQAHTFDVPVGTILYAVEFVDGSDALVAEADLQPR